MYHQSVKARKITAASLAMVLLLILAIAPASSAESAGAAEAAEAGTIIEETKASAAVNAAETREAAADMVISAAAAAKAEAEKTEAPAEEEASAQVFTEEAAAPSESVTEPEDAGEEGTGEETEVSDVSGDLVQPSTLKVIRYVTEDEPLAFSTVYEDTDLLMEGESKVKQEGVEGVKRVTYRQCVVNGKTIHSEVYSEEVVAQPVNKIVLNGTRPAVTNDAERQRVVNYALQFVGNPYRYGGTSLTDGCDCSGFIYRVFQDCGYSGVPRVGVESVYPQISASELQPGDVTVYSTHYALYIGNGMEVSAVNESQGIRIHPMYYSNGYFCCGVRIIP